MNSKNEYKQEIYNKISRRLEILEETKKRIKELNELSLMDVTKKQILSHHIDDLFTIKFVLSNLIEELKTLD